MGFRCGARRLPLPGRQHRGADVFRGRPDRDGLRHAAGAVPADGTRELRRSAHRAAPWLRCCRRPCRSGRSPAASSRGGCRGCGARARRSSWRSWSGVWRSSVSAGSVALLTVAQVCCCGPRLGSWRSAAPRTWCRRFSLHDPAAGRIRRSPRPVAGRIHRSGGRRTAAGRRRARFRRGGRRDIGCGGLGWRPGGGRCPDRGSCRAGFRSLSDTVTLSADAARVLEPPTPPPRSASWRQRLPSPYIRILVGPASAEIAKGFPWPQPTTPPL